MIAGEELKAWLADRSRQASSHQTRTQFAQRWSRHPLFAELHRDVDALAAPDREQLRAIAERFMARRDELDTLIDELIAASAADPYFTPPFTAVSSDIHIGLHLFEDPRLSIALGVTSLDALAAKKSGRRGPTSIGFTGFLTLFSFVKAGSATLSFWEAPEGGANFTAQDVAPCRKTGERTIMDGETIVIDGRRESFIIEHAASDIVYLQAVIRVGAAPVAVEYDSASLAYVGASSTDEASSRLQIMSSLLRLMDRTDAAPILAEALKSPHFYTRWHVMRELLALDAELAFPHLVRFAAEDPHPDVRAAAKATLDAFFPDAAPPEQESPEQESIACRA